MVLIKTYSEFVHRVNELGFMTLSPLIEGFPSLSNETQKQSWHTGNYETDPWKWKDRVAEEKKLVYGCVIGGHKGFISKEYYPLFFKAYHPNKLVKTRWELGEITRMTWELWQVFEGKESLSTSEIRKMLGVTKKNGGSTLDTSIKKLQSHFYITVVGNKRKLNKHLEPYGWPSTVYAKVEDYLPVDWYAKAYKIDKGQAIDQILTRAMEISSGLDKTVIGKKLGLN